MAGENLCSCRYISIFIPIWFNPFFINKEGYRYRCIVKDESGNTEISKEAKIVFGQKNPIAITCHPEDFYGSKHDTARFHVVAESADGSGLVYQWQISTDGGESWADLSYNTVGSNTDTLEVTFIKDKEGYQYRCRVRKQGWNGKVDENDWIDSRGAKIIFGQPTPTASPGPEQKKINITEQPRDYWGSVHSTAEFRVKAEGQGIQYQWVVSKDKGKTWIALSHSTKGYNENVLRVAWIGSKEGYIYKCKLKDKFENTAESDWADIHISKKGEQHIYYTEVIKKATLKKNGSILRTCSICGYKKTIVIPYPKTIRMSRAFYSYTGKKQKPPVVVKGSDGNKIPTSNYTVKYSGKCVDVGKCSVTVTFKKYYKGSKKLTCMIKEAENTITAPDITKTVSEKPQTFKINAKANGNAKLSYRSDNSSVNVDRSGKVTVKKRFIGEAGIMVTAAKTGGSKGLQKRSPSQSTRRLSGLPM